MDSEGDGLMEDDHKQAIWLGLGGAVLIAWCYTVHSITNPGGDGAVLAGVGVAISTLIAGCGGYILAKKQG